MQTTMAEQAPPVPQRPNCTPLFNSSPCGVDWQNYRAQVAAYNQWINQHNHELVNNLQSQIQASNQQLEQVNAASQAKIAELNQTITHLQTHLNDLQQQVTVAQNETTQARQDGTSTAWTCLTVGLVIGLVLGIVAHRMLGRFRVSRVEEPKARAASF